MPGHFRTFYTYECQRNIRQKDVSKTQKFETQLELKLSLGTHVVLAKWQKGNCYIIMKFTGQLMLWQCLSETRYIHKDVSRN